MRDLSNQVIKNYELRELIGAGGFGAVYRAHQRVVERDVAVKVVLPRYADRPSFIRSFEAEAQLIARLEHPHIVPLFDYWREPGGAFLVMRWLRGGSLRSRLEQGPLAPDMVATVLNQIAGALSVAHRNGIVHRDIKPANVLLDEDENAYLTDFGIAVQVEAADSRDEEGRVVGSPAYLSPEQVRGEVVSPRSDIYSLAIVTYQLLTGEHPFALSDTDKRRSTTIMVKHLTETIPSIQDAVPGLSEDVNLVIQQAASKDPVGRFPDVVSFATAFNRAIAGDDPVPLTESGSHRVIIEPGEETFVSDSLLELEVLNPYKGLRPFEQADASDFFGRSAVIEQLVARLGQAEPAFLAVVGPSGSGKSSVVKAGLIPALRNGAIDGSENWYIAEMVPGSDPFEELASALTAVAVAPTPDMRAILESDAEGLLRVVISNTNKQNQLLLVIDQFEELFTVTRDEQTRQIFLSSLLTALSNPDTQLNIIITLRADFYDRPLLYPEFGALIRESTEIILPLTHHEMREAITEPANRAGLKVTSELADAIIDELQSQPGSLPFLQYILTELCEQRKGLTLTLDTYHKIGGALQALAHRAEDLFTTLDDHTRDATRQLFLRLVNLGEGTEDTRRRILRASLPTENREELNSAIELFARYRLLTLDYDPTTRQPTIEIAHEALLRSWNRLRVWLDDSRDDLRTRQQIAQAANEWAANNRDNGYLAAGTRLDNFRTWQQTTDLTLNQIEAEFLTMSVAQQQEALRAEVERQAREAALRQRVQRLVQGLAGVFFVATIIAALLAVVAYSGQQSADRNAKTATVAQGIAEVQAANAQTQAAVATQAQGNALVAADRESTAAAQAQRSADQAKSLALASSAQIALQNYDRELAIALALDANRIADPPLDAQRALARAAQAPGTRSILSGHDDLVTSLDFSPDSTRLLTASLDGTIILWDIASGVRLLEIALDGIQFFSVAVNPDGTTALSGSDDGLIRLWDLTTGEVIREYAGHTGDVNSVAFSSTGRYLVSASTDRTARLWNVETGEELRRYVGHQDTVSSATFSTNEYYVLTGSQDGTVRLWEIDTAEIVRLFAGHTALVPDVAFRPNSDQVASVGFDYTARLWDVQAEVEVNRFLGHTDFVYTLAFSPTGNWLITGAFDSTLRLWDVQTGAELDRFVGHAGRVFSVAFSPDGQIVASGASDGEIRLWDVRSGAQVRQFADHKNEVTAFAYSADGRRIMSSSLDGSLRLWDAGTGAPLVRYDGHQRGVTDVALGEDIAISASMDQSVVMWDVNTGQVIEEFSGHSDIVDTVSLSSDERIAVSGGHDSQIIVWDLLKRTDEHRLIGHTNWVLASDISPDGTQALSGGSDATMILWDLATGDILRQFAHNAPVLAVTFSPDGKRALSGSIDRTMRLWDVDTGQELLQFTGHTERVYAVAFSSDGELGLSGSQDNTLILWDLATGVPIRTFTGHSGTVYDVRFGPDGDTAISAGADGLLIQWQINQSLDDLIGWTYANRHVRELTCRERSIYRIEPSCDEDGQVATRTPYPTLVPSTTPSPTPTLDITATTPTPTTGPTAGPTATPTDAGFETAYGLQ